MGIGIQPLSKLVAYQPGSVVSRKVLGGKRGNVTLFASAEGKGLTEHTTPYAALVVILDGEARIRIGGAERRALGREAGGEP